MPGIGSVKILTDQAILSTLPINQVSAEERNRLPYNSNVKVWMQCETCHEIFQREWAHKSARHMCPTHVHRSNVPMKWCVKCNSYRELQYFAADNLTIDHLAAMCLACRPYPTIPSYEQVMATCVQEQIIRLECKLLHPEARPPVRTRTTDAGYDISAIAEHWIYPGQVAHVSTGIALSCPAGYYYSVDGRSSLWMQGIVPFRGIIDATYTGELIVILMNSSNDVVYHIHRFDRIAQVILHKINHCDINIVDDFTPHYNQRGQSGFGSSGK